jgi:hypothetical protein
MAKAKQSRQERYRVEYEIAYDDIKGQTFLIGPRATVGAWATPDGRKRARALARKTARQAARH